MRRQREPIRRQVTRRVAGHQPIRAQQSLQRPCGMSSGSSGLTGFSVSGARFFLGFFFFFSHFLFSPPHPVDPLSLSLSLDPLHPRHTSAGCEIVQRNAPFLRSEARVTPEDIVPKQTAADRTCFQQSKHERTSGVQR